MVVVIVGLSLAGCVAFKLAGANAGRCCRGLDGVISSTATTVTYSRRAKENPERTPVSPR